MRVNPRAVCAHPTVMALDETTRTVLLALLREADQWGELTPAQAVAASRAVTRDNAAATACLARLHAVRLAHRDAPVNRVIVWTPQQRDDADVFAESEAG